MAALEIAQDAVRAAYQEGRPERAIRLFSKSLRLDAAQPSVLVHRALAYQRCRMYPKAVADCRSALSLQPSLARASLLLGDLLLRQEDPMGALEAWSKGCAAVGPESDPDAAFQLFRRVEAARGGVARAKRRVEGGEGVGGAVEEGEGAEGVEGAGKVGGGGEVVRLGSVERSWGHVPPVEEEFRVSAGSWDVERRARAAVESILDGRLHGSGAVPSVAIGAHVALWESGVGARGGVSGRVDLLGELTAGRLARELQRGLLAVFSKAPKTWYAGVGEVVRVLGDKLLSLSVDGSASRTSAPPPPAPLTHRQKEALRALSRSASLGTSRPLSSVSLGQKPPDRGGIGPRSVSALEAVAITDRGVEAVNAGRWEEAEQVLSLLLADTPDFLPALLARGSGRAMRGNLTQALDDLDAAVFFAPDSADARKRRAQVLLAQNHNAAGLASIGGAVAIIEETFLKHPAIAPLVSEIQKKLNSAPSSSPSTSSTSSTSTSSTSSFSPSSSPTSSSSLSSALSLLDSDAFVARGRAMLALGLPRAGASDGRVAVAAEGGGGGGWGLLGRALGTLGLVDVAVESLEVAKRLAMGPGRAAGRADVLASLAQVLKAKGDAGRAREALEEALRSDAGLERAWHLLSQVHHSSGCSAKQFEAASRGLLVARKRAAAASSSATKTPRTTDLSSRFLALCTEHQDRIAEVSPKRSKKDRERERKAYAGPSVVARVAKAMRRWGGEEEKKGGEGVAGFEDGVECAVFRLLALQAMGQMRRALVGWSAFLAVLPRHLLWTARDWCAWQAKTLDVPMHASSWDVIVPAAVREGFAKRQHPASPLPDGYSPDLSLPSSLEELPPDVSFSLPPPKPAAALLSPALAIGAAIQYRCPGFAANARQFLQSGIAAIHLAQRVRAHLRLRSSSPSSPLLIPDAASSSLPSVRRAKRRALRDTGGKGGKGGGGEEGGRGKGGGGEEGGGGVGGGGGEEEEGGGGVDEGADGMVCGVGEVWRRWEEGGGEDGMHPLIWRDLFDVLVRWRQHSEPFDPVFWIDRLTASAFAEGFGLQTPMAQGQGRNVRYFSMFERCVKLVASLAKQQLALTDARRAALEHARTCDALWACLERDSWVTVPCYSTARPPTNLGAEKEYARAGKGRIMEGTRITLVRTATVMDPSVGIKVGRGFELTIRTPGTPQRWGHMEEELDVCWQRLEHALLHNSSQHTVARHVLRMYYFWVVMGPLTRGTAAVGLTFLLALALAAALPLRLPPPPGVQVDWEAILQPDSEQFVKDMLPILFPTLVEEVEKSTTPTTPTTPLPTLPKGPNTSLAPHPIDVDDLPDVQDAIPNLRTFIQLLNTKKDG